MKHFFDVFSCRFSPMKIDNNKRNGGGNLIRAAEFKTTLRANLNTSKFKYMNNGKTAEMS